MYSIFIFFLIFLVPGIIATLAYGLVSKRNIKPCCHGTIISLIFDLLILIIILAGLYLFKGICEFVQLTIYFNCLSFTIKYALLSIGIGIILAIIAGLIARLFHCHPKHHHIDKGGCC